MFSTQKDYNGMKASEILIDVMEELDAIKRYVANIYEKTDTEVAEIRDIVKRIESQTRETDRQVDKIENFERTLNDIKSMLKRLERKM